MTNNQASVWDSVWVVSCESGCGIQYEQAAREHSQAPYCCGNCGNEAIRIRLLMSVPPSTFLPEVVTPRERVREPETADNGLWYCYDLQVWIRRGIILPCNHWNRGLARMGPAACCYAGAHAGERHATCPSCH